MPLAGYASVPVSSTLQSLPPTPEGPAVVAASTVTAWLTHTLGLASFGVLSNTDTGSLSTSTVSDSDVVSPAAFVAMSPSGSGPAPGT